MRQKRSSLAALWVGIICVGLVLIAGLAISLSGGVIAQAGALPGGAAAEVSAEFQLAASVPLTTPTMPPSPTFTPTATGGFTRTPTAIPTCGTGSDYVISQQSGASIAPGTTDTGNHCDDCSTAISLPFIYNLYGLPFDSAILGSNGTLGLAANSNTFDNSCLPVSTFAYAILPYWDDLLTADAGYGVFTSVSGSPPNQIFNIEWRACLYANGFCGGDVNFEVRLYQGMSRFDLLYGNLADGGSSATVGVQRANGASSTQFECNTGGLTSGLQLIFQPAQCIGPTFTPTRTPQPTATSTPPAACGPDSNYLITAGTADVTLGSDLVIGSQCDDCTVLVSLPFSYTLYGAQFGDVIVSSNGNLQFTSDNTAFANRCLPIPTMTDLIAAYWDDLLLDNTTFSGEGVYTGVTGSAPNRMFIIEWRGEYASDNTPISFEALLYENQARFDVIYGTVSQVGSSATVGAQRGMGPQITQYECNTAGSVVNGRLLTFMQPSCATPTPTATPPPATLSGHVTWQGISQPNVRSQLPITLTLKLGATEINYPTQNTDASGYFTVSVSSLPPGVYNWRVKGPRFLANCGTVTLGGLGGLKIEDYRLKILNSEPSTFNLQPSTPLEAGLMKGGDANNDNLANIGDLNILKITFGRSLGDPNYDPRADFNNDNIINLPDFNTLKLNFGVFTCGAILSP